MTDLHLAVLHDNLAYAAKLLKSKDADPNVPCEPYGSPLILAATRGKTAMVSLLLSSGAWASGPSPPSLDTHPLVAAVCTRQRAVAEVLIREGNLDINARMGPGGVSLLSRLASSGQFAEVDVLLDLNLGADIDSPGLMGVTPLLAHTVRGNFEGVEALVKRGANVTVKNDYGRAPMHAVAFIQYPSVTDAQIVEIIQLLKTGSVGDNHDIVPLEQPGGDDEIRPLGYAARFGNVRAVRALLDCGADINAVNAAGQTALHSSLIDSHIEVAELLLQRGINYQARDKHGNQAVELVVQEQAEQEGGEITNEGDTSVEAVGTAEEAPKSRRSEEIVEHAVL